MFDYKKAIKTKEEIEKMGYFIDNNIIEKMDINIVGRFGNITTFEMWFKDCCLFSGYNLGGLLPFILKAVVEILEISSDSGTRISNVKDVPCRTIFTSKLGRVVGFGNFMKDKFVFADDLIKLAREELEEYYKNII